MNYLEIEQTYEEFNKLSVLLNKLEQSGLDDSRIIVSLNNNFNSSEDLKKCWSLYFFLLLSFIKFFSGSRFSLASLFFPPFGRPDFKGFRHSN